VHGCRVSRANGNDRIECVCAYECNGGGEEGDLVEFLKHLRVPDEERNEVPSSC